MLVVRPRDRIFIEAGLRSYDVYVTETPASSFAFVRELDLLDPVWDATNVGSVHNLRIEPAFHVALRRIGVGWRFEDRAVSAARKPVGRKPVYDYWVTLKRPLYPCRGVPDR